MMRGMRSGRMRLGLIPPMVNRNPRFQPPEWEQQAGIEEMGQIAERAEALGYEFMCFPHHVAIPVDVAPVRGSTYWDPAATMGYVAARTQRIRLATYVIVLAYYHPLQIAKTFGTVDRISGGRLILGVGVGTLEPEFRLIGAQYEGRGERADDAIRALRAVMSSPRPSYHGPHYDIEGWIVDPCALQERVPIWIGGRTPRSLRRALELADAWCPFGHRLDGLEPMLAKQRDLIDERGDSFDVVLAPEPPLDPLGEPEATAETVRRYREAGATMLNLRFRHRSPAHYLEQLEAMTQLTGEA